MRSMGSDLINNEQPRGPFVQIEICQLVVEKFDCNAKDLADIEPLRF
jgi:hypothetical protein